MVTMITLITLLLLAALTATVAVALGAWLWRALLRWDKGISRAYLEAAWRWLFPSRGLGWQKISRRILTRMRREVVISTGGAAVVPSSYHVGLSQQDLDTLGSMCPFVEDDLAGAITSEARRNGWLCDARPAVTISIDLDAVPGFPRVRAVFGRPDSVTGSLRPAPTVRMRRAPTVAEGLTPAPTEPWVVTELANVDPFGADIDLSERHVPLQLGRADANDVVLNHPNVSEVHAILRPLAEGWELRDLGSRNGTYCNEEPVTGPVRLRHGDTVSFARGGPRFVFSRLAPNLPSRRTSAG